MKKIIDRLHNMHVKLSPMAEMFKENDEKFKEICETIDKIRSRLSDIKNIAK